MPTPTTIKGTDKVLMSNGDNGESMAPQFDQLKQYLSITGIDLNPSDYPPGSALPTGPLGENRRITNVIPGSYTWNGNTYTVPEGYTGTLFWNGSSWSLTTQELPVPEGTNLVVKNGTEIVNQDGVFRAVDPITAGIAPNVFYNAYTINHSSSVPGVYNSVGVVTNQGELGYRRTNILPATSNKIKIKNVLYAFSLLFFNEQNVFVASTLLKVGEGVYDLPAGATKFAFNLEHPLYQTSTTYNIEIEEQKTSVKQYVDSSTFPLINLPESKSSLVVVTSDMKLPGIYNATGQVINSGAEGMYRSPLIPVDTNHIWIEGMLFNFNIILFNENQQFVELRVPTNGSYNGDISSTIKYVAFTLEHPAYQTRTDYSIDISVNRKDVAAYIEEVIGRESFDLKGKNVVYADDWVDEEDADKINKAIYHQAQSMNGGAVIVKDRTYLLNQAIIIRDNVELLLDNAKLKLKDGVFDNIIRTHSINPDPANPNGLCLSLGETKKFKILGLNGSSIEGADIPYTALNPKTGVNEPWVGDYYGWRTIGILVANGKDYEIAGFKMSKTHCWGISQEWGCDGMKIHDIEFDTNVKNGDGIDFRNGCRNGKVWNIFGKTSDDTVAMTALDASFNWDTPSSPYIFPLQTMGFEYSLDNGIENIEIDNVHCSGAHHVIILLATSTKIKGINISNISDLNSQSTKTEIIRAYSSYGTGYINGNISDVSMNNIIANKISNYVVDMAVPVNNVRINKLRNLGTTGSIYNIASGSTDVIVSNY
ncbi:hypothetical protein BC792_12730 [Sphingobacterium allocomposti]|uniref:Uncharacterized protein n=2 Tax=Sphingobacterium allocomposti TaxID=415956 RepID=A0A5S5D434_9SPHI|nr:hypothetical protein BC792_12730 [Sphingobacterium composti Yoo et al. 2007 non Ten et al. 2007]